MKYIKSILAILLCAITLVSCSEWLDVNTNPETPTSSSATIETRLPWMEYYVLLTDAVAGFRTTMQCGDWTRTATNGGNYFYSSYWNPVNGICTTAYQQLFVGGLCNNQDLYDKAMAQGAYHYAAVSKMFNAIGYMIMTDLYGEMPYTDACSENATPVYDNGKTIYLGCLKELDEAIELFGRTQEAGAPALSNCDWWNNGNIDKWTKLAYLLKARYGVKLSKKAPGSLAEGKYDAEAILAALQKGPQSINDDTAVDFLDEGTSFRVAIYGDPSDINGYYSVLGMNAGYMVTAAFEENFTNFNGLGIEDPRADKHIPWQYSIKGPDTPDNVKYVGNWRRSKGVDMTSSASPVGKGGPIRSNFDASGNKGWWISSNDPTRLADTLYVEATCGSTGYGKEPDLFFRRVGGNDRARESGSFYARATTPQYVGTYCEACFIKAEVLFNQGKKTEAYAAYKEGVKANFDMMNKVLSTYTGKNPAYAECPSFTVMSASDVNNYLNNALGTADNLTLGKIMTQKKMAFVFSLQIWNDMRRYDYNPDIFFNWQVAYNYAVTAATNKVIPQGKQWRRWRQCSHELNYNSTNLHAIGAEVPGADMSLEQWNNAQDVWTIPVWWDSKQE